MRPYVDPEVVREVCLVTVASRRWSRPVATFVQAIRRYDWPVAENATAVQEADRAALRASAPVE